MHLIFPLISSILYVIAAMFMKQAAEQRVGIWRSAFVCNWITAILFLLLLPLGGQLPEGHWHEPFIVALLFFAGQLLTFVALDKGDVSVATPVLGAKVILVAGFTLLLTEEAVRWQLWLAALFTCVGIALLNKKGDHHRAEHLGRTIIIALFAAAAYASFDVFVMKWAPAWGAGRFLPIMVGINAIYSCAFIPFFREPLSAIKGPAMKPVVLGGFFLGLQAVVLVSTLARFGDATAVNVIYSTRGLWSVLAVLFLGHWFANTEKSAGPAVMKARLAGAASLCAAVVLVFI